MASAHTNVYATNLPDGMDDASFRLLFEAYGSIASVKLVSDRKYGFVKFNQVQEAQLAIDALNGAQYAGTTLTVRFANNPQTQGPYAPAPYAAAAGGGAAGGLQTFSGSSAGPGSFSNASPPPPPEAQTPWKRPWEAAAGGPNNGGAAAWDAGSAAEAVPSDNLYVKGLPPNITDQWLRSIFGEYGIVTSTKVMAPSDGAHTESVALVRMGSTEEASWLVANLNGNIPQGLDRPVQVRFADPPGKKQMRTGQAAPTASVLKMAPAPMMARSPSVNMAQAPSSFIPGGGDASNLYVKALPPTADDLYLYRVFAQYGAIQSVRATMTPEGSCVGYGFVKFVTDADAQNALQAINGCQLSDGNTLLVAVKTEKRK